MWVSLSGALTLLSTPPLSKSTCPGPHPSILRDVVNFMSKNVSDLMCYLPMLAEIPKDLGSWVRDWSSSGWNFRPLQETTFGKGFVLVDLPQASSSWDVCPLCSHLKSQESEKYLLTIFSLPNTLNNFYFFILKFIFILKNYSAFPPFIILTGSPALY